MRQTILSIMLMLITLGINAQTNSPVDSLFKKLKDINVHVSRMRENCGGGLISNFYDVAVNDFEKCTSGCPEHNRHPIDSDEDVEKANKRRREKGKRAISIIREEIDKLMPLAEEAYHFETHKKSGDTINYSLCLKYSDDEDDEIKKETYRDQIYFSNAIETLSFEYTNNPVEGCDKHRNGWGALYYTRNEQLPSGETLPFDWEGYCKLIMPLLKQKGVRARTFKWAQPNDPEYRNKPHEDFYSAYQVSTWYGKTTEGESEGVIYTIPCDKQELAIALLDSINSITERFLDEHKEQRHSYLCGERFRPNKNGFAKGFFTHTNMFAAIIDDNIVSCHRVETAMNEDGYHILVYKSRGAVWIPKDFSKLKSIINGVKEYYE